jgi:hypothetical protein
MRSLVAGVYRFRDVSFSKRWQTTYLPVFALWAASVVVVLPLVFGFS